MIKKGLKISNYIYINNKRRTQKNDPIYDRINAAYKSKLL
jgi:hypothetical protein